MDLSSLPSDPLSSYLPYIISILVGLVTIIRSYMSGTTCPNSLHINGKNVLITGASSGIGFETAKQLALRGGHIIMCSRDLKKGKAAMDLIRAKKPDAKLTLKKLDLRCSKSVRNLASCLENFKIDILINNAGVCFHPYKATEEGHESHMASNYFGHFLLTHLLVDNLKMSTQGRIINVCAKPTKPANLPLTTTLDEATYVSNEWFKQSKYALVLMTKHMAKLLKGTNITINSLNPGMVRGTRHNRHNLLLNHWSGRLTIGPWMWLLMKSPAQGAQTSIFLATEPTVSSKTGRFYSNCTEEVLEDDDLVETAKTLYENTCALLDVTPISGENKENVKSK